MQTTSAKSAKAVTRRAARRPARRTHTVLKIRVPSKMAKTITRCAWEMEHTPSEFIERGIDMYILILRHFQGGDFGAGQR